MPATSNVLFLLRSLRKQLLANADNDAKAEAPIYAAHELLADLDAILAEPALAAVEPTMLQQDRLALADRDLVALRRELAELRSTREAFPVLRPISS